MLLPLLSTAILAMQAASSADSTQSPQAFSDSTMRALACEPAEQRPTSKPDSIPSNPSLSMAAPHSDFSSDVESHATLLLGARILGGWNRALVGVGTGERGATHLVFGFGGKYDVDHSNVPDVKTRSQASGFELRGVMNFQGQAHKLLGYYSDFGVAAQWENGEGTVDSQSVSRNGAVTHRRSTRSSEKFSIQGVLGIGIRANVTPSAAITFGAEIGPCWTFANSTSSLPGSPSSARRDTGFELRTPAWTVGIAKVFEIPPQ